MKIYNVSWHNTCYSNKEDKDITLCPGYHNHINEMYTDDFDVFLVFGFYEELVGEPIKVLGIYTTFEEAYARQENENLSIRDEYFLARIALLNWGQELAGCPQFVR